MTEVICLASSKGGSGKTTITASIGTFLARSGRKVLLIDCDEATHGLTLMYLDEVNSHRKSLSFKPLGTFDVSESSNLEKLEFSLVNVNENLYLLPARHVFKDVDSLPIGKKFDNFLNSIITLFRSDFDFILIDAQAGISSASRAAMSTKNSDLVILASEYDPMSNAGIERMKARLPDELDVGRTWILLNKLLPEFVSKFSEFLSVARYLPPIPWTADVVRAYSRRGLALDFDAGNQYTLAILAVLRELLDPLDLVELEMWIESKTQRLREPIREQLADTEILLKNMEALTAREINTKQSIPYLFLKQFSMIFGLLSAILATAFGASDLFNLSELFDYIFSNPIAVILIGGFGLITLLTYLMEGFRRTIREDQQRSKREAEHIFSEMKDLEERVSELRTLSSARFEDIVSKQNKAGKNN